MRAATGLVDTRLAAARRVKSLLTRTPELWYLVTLMKPPVPNPGYDRTAKVLIDAGYRCASEFERKPERGFNIPELRFEIWIGTKGCVMVQVWKDGCGCDVYTNWHVGHTDDELKAAL